MRTRSVRLDAEAERALAEICRSTGMSISRALKHGLLTARDALRNTPTATAYEIFQSLDLGEGGYARGSAGRAKQDVRRIIRQKHHR